MISTAPPCASLTGGLDRVASADLASNGKRLAGLKIRGITGISVARGTVEGRLVAVGKDRATEYAAEGVGKAENLGLARIREADRSRVVAN